MACRRARRRGPRQDQLSLSAHYGASKLRWALDHLAEVRQARDAGTLRSGDARIALTAVNGDQSAAVFAFGWPDADSAYVNIGTSAFVQRAVTRNPGHVPRQLTGIVLDDGTQTIYTVEGNGNGAGTALEWLAHDVGVDDVAPHLPSWLDSGEEPLLFLNGIAGLGGPFWQPDFPSRYVGAGTTAQRAAAVVESIAFLLQANIDAMAAHVPPAKRIRVSGGVSRLDGLCQRLASVSGLPVYRRDDPEATTRGIAFLAARMPTDWNVGEPDRVFAPADDVALRARYRRWRALMAEATGV